MSNRIVVTVGSLAANQVQALNEADDPAADNPFITQSALDAVIVETGDTNAEVVSARGGFPSLDARLDNIASETGAGVTDHGELTGLGDDDHPQYLTQARGDARYYTETEVNQALALKEGALGNPGTNGYVLTSTTAGVRSWAVLPSGGTGGGVIVVASNDAATDVKAAAYSTCDGTDDDVQIQAALNLAATYGHMVQLTAGRYFVRAPLNMNRTNGGLVLAGTGDGESYTRGGTTITVHTSGFPTGRAIIESGTTTYSPGNQIRDLTIDGRGQTYSVIHGIHTAAYSGRISNVTVNDCSGWGIHAGSDSFNSTDTRFESVTVKACDLGGFGALAGGSRAADMHWINCLIFNLPNTATAGIHLNTGTAGAHIIGGQIYDNACPGILVVSVTHLITGMKIENNNHGIHFTGGRGTAVTGCGFRGNSYSTDNTYDNIYVQSGSHISITGGRNISNVDTGTPANIVRYGINLGASSSYVGVSNMVFDVYNAGSWGTAKAINSGSNNSIAGINYP